MRFRRDELTMLISAVNDAVRYLDILIEDEFTVDEDVKELYECKDDYLAIRNKLLNLKD